MILTVPDKIEKNYRSEFKKVRQSIITNQAHIFEELQVDLNFLQILVPKTVHTHE